MALRHAIAPLSTPADVCCSVYRLIGPLPYSIYSGVLGDHYDLRKMIAGGMWATGAIVLLFGLGAFADIHSLSFYAVLWGLNGLIQSCGWPANVAVMYVGAAYADGSFVLHGPIDPLPIGLLTHTHTLTAVTFRSLSLLYKGQVV